MKRLFVGIFSNETTLMAIIMIENARKPMYSKGELKSNMTIKTNIRSKLLNDGWIQWREKLKERLVIKDYNWYILLQFSWVIYFQPMQKDQ